MSEPKLCLSVTFWGEEFRCYFLKYCLASLLSPGNLPAITDKSAARFLIATTPEDWESLRDEPAMRAAQRMITFEHVPFFPAEPQTPMEKMLVMSRAHKLLAERMHAEGVYGIFLYPDIILATGYIAGLEALARRGVAVALCISVRFCNETLLAELDVRGLVKRGEPIAIDPKHLARLAISHMHSELVRCGFDNPFFDYGAASFFWVVKAGEDLLFHSGNWVPALIDYRAIKAHDVTAFDTFTLDGDYVAKNFSDPRVVHVINDTTEIFMVSFTPEAKTSYSLKPHLPYKLPRLRSALKVWRAHAFLYEQGFLDPVKRAHFYLPIRMRGGDSSEHRWQEAEARALQTICAMERGYTGRASRVLLGAIRICWRYFFRPLFINPVRHVRDFLRVRYRRFRNRVKDERLG